MALFFCWGFTYALVVVGVVVERYSGVAVSLIILACDRHRLVPSYQSIPCPTRSLLHTVVASTNLRLAPVSFTSPLTRLLIGYIHRDVDS